MAHGGLQGRILPPISFKSLLQTKAPRKLNSGQKQAERRVGTQAFASVSSPPSPDADRGKPLLFSFPPCSSPHHPLPSHFSTVQRQQRARREYLGTRGVFILSSISCGHSNLCCRWEQLSPPQVSPDLSDTTPGQYIHPTHVESAGTKSGSLEEASRDCSSPALPRGTGSLSSITTLHRHCWTSTSLLPVSSW